MNKIVVTVITGVALSMLALNAGADVRSACANDVKTLCAGIKPGGGRIKSCIREHKDQLSSACKNALAERASHRNKE